MRYGLDDSRLVKQMNYGSSCRTGRTESELVSKLQIRWK